MMRKMMALLLALLLCTAGLSAAFAEAAPDFWADNWYLNEAHGVIEAMDALADNEAYVELFIGMGEDTDGFADQMAQVDGLNYEAIYFYRYRTDALQELAAAYQMDEVTTALSKPAMEAVYRRMNLSLGSMLNGHVGGSLWLAVASALEYSQTYVMPEDFEPCALFFSYVDQEASILVTFSQTGEDTVTAVGTYVRPDVWLDEVGQTYLSLMWEPLEGETPPAEATPRGSL